MAGRRTFINQAALTAGAIFFRPLNLFAGTGASSTSIASQRTLSIFHAAGLEGQWKPLEKPHALHGLGGLLNLQKEIQTIRKQSISPLLIQSGNIVGHQCNEEECSRFYKALGDLHFDVVVPGALDLAHGKDTFVNLANNSALPVSLFRHTVANSEMALSSKVIVKNGVRIGIIHAAGQSIQNAETLNKTAKTLKAKKCLLVICVAEWKAKDCDAVASLSESVDVLLTTEETTSLNTTKILQNKQGHEVVLSFAGAKGTLLNRMDFSFNEKGEKINLTSSTIFTGATAQLMAGMARRATLFNA